MKCEACKKNNWEVWDMWLDEVMKSLGIADDARFICNDCCAHRWDLCRQYIDMQNAVKEPETI